MLIGKGKSSREVKNSMHGISYNDRATCIVLGISFVKIDARFLRRCKCREKEEWELEGGGGGEEM